VVVLATTNSATEISPRPHSCNAYYSTPIFKTAAA